MANNTKSESKKHDRDLVEHAKAFSAAFIASAAKGNTVASFAEDSGISMGAAGTVEISQAVADPLAKFMSRTESLLDPAESHRRSIYDTALKEAHEAVAKNKTADQAATQIIDAVWQRALTSFTWVSPNQLFKLMNGISEIRIGSVRALRTEAFTAQRAQEYPDEKLSIVPSDHFSLNVTQDAVTLSMLPTCWAVEVDAISEHVETEGKWAIDVAVSFLRLKHSGWQGHVPSVGHVEPHPTVTGLHHNEGAKFAGPNVQLGGSSVPPWYEIDSSVIATTSTAEFIAQADLLFKATSKSLAERVNQGLGWLTRGRQSVDRAERLLFFFTAIEALLSNDDKTAPVTQTIARHAAVMLTNANQDRVDIAALIKKLYVSRSSLVHSGNRSVSGWAANQTQLIAEDLFFVCLSKTDLGIAHATFCQALANASYGLPWPAPAASVQATLQSGHVERP